MIEVKHNLGPSLFAWIGGMHDRMLSTWIDMRHGLAGLFVILTMAFGLQSFALAQTTTPDGNPIENPGQDLLNERRAEEEREAQINARPGIRLNPSNRVPDVEDPFCFEFDDIIVEGVTQIRRRVLQRLVREHSSACMGQSAIAKMMEAVQNRYTELGYVTSEILIPEQDLNGRVLTLLVVEGRIESVASAEADYSSDRRILSALSTDAGAVLNMRDFEAMTDAMSRPGSAKASVQLLPGQEVGGTAVFVEIEEDEEAKTRYSFNLSASGDEESQSPNASLSATYDNLADLNDTLVLTGSRGQNNASLSAAYTYALNRWTHNSSLALSQYTSDLGNGTSLDGAATSFAAFGDRILFRNAEHKVKLTYSLDWSQNDRKIGVLELTPTFASTGKLGLQDTFTGKKGAWTFGLDVQRGTPLGDAPSDPEIFCPDGYLECSQTSLEGLVTSFSINRVKPLGESGNASHIWTLRGQHADRPTAYALGLGGWGSIRGFAGSQFSSDYGYLLQNELTVSDPFPGCWMTQEGQDDSTSRVKKGDAEAPWYCDLSSFITLDGGQGYSYALGTKEHVAGTSLGLRYSQGSYTGDLSFGTGLHSPNEDIEGDWIFKTSFGIAF